MTILQSCPPHLPDVATLPWKIQKVIFLNIIIHMLQIIYVTSDQIATVSFSCLLTVV